MTANEFLGQLEQCLNGLSSDERENAMSYYREYFMEAGEENEDEAAARLGSPQSVAERIISEAGEIPTVLYSESQEKAAEPASEKSSGSSILLGILILIVGFPLWIVLLSLAFALLVTLIALIFAFTVAGIASMLAGIVSIVTGGISAGLFGLGSGLFCIGFVMLTWKSFALAIAGVFNLLKKLVLKIFGRR